jgi:hypothetical protein
MPFFSLGCSGGMSRGKAAAPISRSLLVARVSTWLLLGRVGTECAVDPTKDPLLMGAQAAGLATVTQDGPGFWYVERPGLKQLSSNASQPLPGCEFQRLRQDLARKTLVEVSSVHRTSDSTVEAEFKWKWQLTSDGKKLLGALSPAQVRDLEPYFDYPATNEEDLREGLANLERNATIHTGKRTLTKSKNGWRAVIDRESASDIMGAHLSDTADIMPDIGRVGSHCIVVIRDTEVDLDKSPETRIEAIVAKMAGYISVAPDGKNYWRVGLTDKGLAALRFSKVKALSQHDGVKGCDYQVAFFYVARQSLVNIETVTDDEEAPTVTYLWKWIPGDLGMALSKNGALYSTLTQAQKNDLEHYLSASTIGPPLPLPVPTQDDSPVMRDRAKLYKEVDGNWH